MHRTGCNWAEQKSPWKAIPFPAWGRRALPAPVRAEQAASARAALGEEEPDPAAEAVERAPARRAHHDYSGQQGTAGTGMAAGRALWRLLCAAARTAARCAGAHLAGRDPLFRAGPARSRPCETAGDGMAPCSALDWSVGQLATPEMVLAVLVAVATSVLLAWARRRAATRRTRHPRSVVASGYAGQRLSPTAAALAVTAVLALLAFGLAAPERNSGRLVVDAQYGPVGAVVGGAAAGPPTVCAYLCRRTRANTRLTATVVSAVQAGRQSKRVFVWGEFGPGEVFDSFVAAVAVWRVLVRARRYPSRGCPLVRALALRRRLPR